MDNLEYIENSVVSGLSDKLPRGWGVLEERDHEIPYGHYWNMEYEGERGYMVTFQGDKEVALKWKDKNDQWKQSYIARETLTLWFMPSCYRHSWKSFFVPKRPIGAELVFSGGSLKVYSMLGHHIVSEDELSKLVSIAKSTRWPDSPVHTGSVSWKDWRNDLLDYIKEEKRKP